MKSKTELLFDFNKAAEAEKLKGVFILIEGTDIAYRYTGMGSGEAMDRLADVRRALIAKELGIGGGADERS